MADALSIGVIEGRRIEDESKPSHNHSGYMTYRRKAAMAATPAKARLPLTVEAAPVNLGGLLTVGEVAFFGATGVTVPVEAGAATTGLVGFWAGTTTLDRVAGHALTVTVTTETGA
jgi:hypothetical protein